MNKYSITSFIIALLLLIVGVLAKFAWSENAAYIALPVMTVGLWVMMAVDTVGYKKQKHMGITKGINIARLVGGYILAAIVTAGTVIYMIYR